MEQNKNIQHKCDNCNTKDIEILALNKRVEILEQTLLKINPKIDKFLLPETQKTPETLEILESQKLLEILEIQKLQKTTKTLETLETPEIIQSAGNITQSYKSNNSVNILTELKKQFETFINL